MKLIDRPKENKNISSSKENLFKKWNKKKKKHSKN